MPPACTIRLVPTTSRCTAVVPSLPCSLKESARKILTRLVSGAPRFLSPPYMYRAFFCNTYTQGLYGHFESEVSDWPVGTTRRSRMVFIGDLPPVMQEALRAGVRSCMVAARPRVLPPPPPSSSSSSSSKYQRSAGAPGVGKRGGGSRPASDQ